MFTFKNPDVTMVTSVVLATTTYIVELNQYLQAGATIVAILAGVVALWYHGERIWDLRQERKKGKDNHAN